MRLIDADALKASLSMGNNCDECVQNPAWCNARSIYSRQDVCGFIDDIPTIEQEPVEPTIGGNQNSCWYYICPICQLAIDKGDRHCRHCGRKVKWDD